MKNKMHRKTPFWKRSRIIAMLMIAAAIIFVGYALGHPEASWIWPNWVSYLIYIIYIVVIIILLAAPF